MVAGNRTRKWNRNNNNNSSATRSSSNSTADDAIEVANASATTANPTTATTSTKSLYEYFDAYEKSDCRVSSNDPAIDLRNGNGGASGTAASASLALKLCNFTQFTCVASSSSGADTRVPIQVPFEYELHYNPNSGADLNSQILPFLEESMLQHIAESLGIAECQQRRERQRRRRRRRRNQRRRQQRVSHGSGETSRAAWEVSTLATRMAQEETGRFAGASLEPKDVWNDNCRNGCMANNSYVAEGDACWPVRGEMTVLVQLTADEQASQLVVSEQDKQTIRDVVSMYIQEAMDEDAYIVSDYIQKVVYIGDSKDDSLCIGGAAVGGTGVAVDAIASNGGNANGGGHRWWSQRRRGFWIGLAALLLLLLLLLCCCCCLCCCRRRRRRRRGRQEETEQGDSPIAAANVSRSSMAAARGFSRSGRRTLGSSSRQVNPIVPAASSASVAPFWGTTSVDDDGEDGVERCLASRDSLALRRGEQSDTYKPSYDEESVGSTTRTSLASGSVVLRDAPDSPKEVLSEPEAEPEDDDDDSEPVVDDDDIDEIPDEESDADDEVARTNLDAPPKKTVILPEDYELLDRLAAQQRTLSPDSASVPGAGDASVQTRDFLAATGSISPTSGSQITALAGNLQRSSHFANSNKQLSPITVANGSTDKAPNSPTTQSRDIEQPSTPTSSQSPKANVELPSLSPPSISTKSPTPSTNTNSPRSPYASNDSHTRSFAGYDDISSPRSASYRLETIEPPSPYASPSSSNSPKRNRSAHAANIDSEIRALAGSLRYPTKYTSGGATQSTVSEHGSVVLGSTSPVGGSYSSSKTFRSPTSSRTMTTTRNTAGASPPPSYNAPKSPKSPKSPNSPKSPKSPKSPVVQPPNHETYTYAPQPQHHTSSFGTAYRSSTYGSQTTAKAGNLGPSPTYGSHATLRTGNLRHPRTSQSSASSNTNYHNRGGYHDYDYYDDDRDGNLAYAPDSFDEEIMGIISEDPSAENFSEELHHQQQLLQQPQQPHHAHQGVSGHNPSDILDGHGAYPDPDGPTMNDAYLSEDSDSEQHSNRSNNTGATTTAADEYAKRRLQMS